MRLLLNNQEGRVIKMKNYLFRPFKDDEEKIEAFNHFKSYLPKGHRNELNIFMGSLESYYDVIISKLQSDECESMGWIEQYRKGCEEYRKEIAELKADNNTLIRSNNKRVDMIKELRSKLAISIKDEEIIQAQGEEIKRLKADIRHDAKVCDDYDDDLIKECRNLQAENESLQDQLKDAVNDYEELVNSPNVK